MNPEPVSESESTEPLTFHEKSAWASLLTTAVIYCPYFVYVFGQFARGTPATVSVWGTFVVAVFLQTVLMIAAHIVFALHGKPEGKDERDLAIEARAFRYAYTMLGALIWTAAGGVLAWAGIQSATSGNHHTISLLLQALLLAFVLAEASKYIVQIAGYRRGH